MRRLGSRLACLAWIALSAAAAAQDPEPAGAAAPAVPAGPYSFGPSGVLPVPQLYSDVPPPAPPARAWASYEYVAWVIGTGKLAEATKEAYNSELFNELLAAGGKDFKDFVRTALGNDRTGFRVRAGAWLDDTQGVGAEAGFLYLNRGPLTLPLGNRDATPLARLAGGADLTFQRDRRFDPSIQDIRHPLLALLVLSRLGVPGIDAGGRLVVVPLSAVDLVNASIKMEIAAKTFWVFDALGRVRLAEGEAGRVDGLLGYRRISYADSLSLYHEVTTLQRPLLPGTRLSTLERVETDNTLDGVLVGLDLATGCGCWTFTARPTVTVAGLTATATRDADTFTSLPSGARGHIKGGAFVAGSDVGTFSTSGWTLVPEIAGTAARTVGEHVRVFLGSSLIYIPEVARAGNQVSFGVDRSRTVAERLSIPQLPNPTTPDLKSIFTVTMSAGLEVRY